MFSYNLAENSIGFSYYLVENIRFTTDLAENRVLFTSATSFTLKRRALLSPGDFAPRAHTLNQIQLCSWTFPI